MAPNEVVPGPIASNVIANVRELRKRADMTLAALSGRLTRLGHPILPTGLQRLEAGKRRVDPDDLVALALALEVAPISLLLPHAEEGKVTLTGAVSAPAEAVWDWVRARGPLKNSPSDPMQLVNHQRRSLPKVAGRKYDMLTPEGKRAYVEDHPDEMVKFLPDGGLIDGQRPETP